MANENDGKIYITISNKPGNGGGVGGSGDSENVRAGSLSADFDSYISHKAFDFGLQQAKQLVNYSISNIGNFTGDYLAQRDVSNNISFILGEVALVGAAAKIGSIAEKKALADVAVPNMLASGIGSKAMLAAVGVAVAGIGINLGYKAISSGFETYKQNLERNNLRDISGLSSTTNGSR